MALAFLMCNLETSILPKPWLAVKIFPKLDKLPVSHKLNFESHKIICSLKTKFFASSTSSGIMSRCWSQPHWCEKPAFTEFLWLQRKCLLSDGGFNIPTVTDVFHAPWHAFQIPLLTPSLFISLLHLPPSWPVPALEYPSFTKCHVKLLLEKSRWHNYMLCSPWAN